MTGKMKGWIGFVGFWFHLSMFGLMMFHWHDAEPTFINMSLAILNFAAIIGAGTWMVYED